MDIYSFMSNSPILTFFIVVGVGLIIESILKYTINRPLRHANIRKHEWPPAHCDADGDFIKKDSD
jgi:hypothetical protein